MHAQPCLNTSLFVELCFAYEIKSLTGIDMISLGLFFPKN